MQLSLTATKCIQGMNCFNLAASGCLRWLRGDLCSTVCSYNSRYHYKSDFKFYFFGFVDGIVGNRVSKKLISSAILSQRAWVWYRQGSRFTGCWLCHREEMMLNSILSGKHLKYTLAMSITFKNFTAPPLLLPKTFLLLKDHFFILFFLSCTCTTFSTGRKSSVTITKDSLQSNACTCFWSIITIADCNLYWIKISFK